MGAPEPAGEIKDLEKVIGSAAPGASADEVEKALGKLLDILEKDPVISGILKARKAGRDDLAAVYRMMENGGAAYWVGGRYVPAASLSVPAVLEYLLAVREKGEVNSLAINQVLGFFDGLTQRLVLPSELMRRR